MAKAKLIRLILIATLIVFGLIAFSVVATPVLSAGENDRHSIIEHWIATHAAVVDFDLGIALTSTLVAIFPTSFIFLMFDLYGLRRTPVKHLGIFAFCLIAVVLNVIASISIWLIYGGWGPPAVGPVMAVILVGTLAPAIISEWRILSMPNNAEEIAD